MRAPPLYCSKKSVNNNILFLSNPIHPIHNLVIIAVKIKGMKERLKKVNFVRFLLIHKVKGFK